MRNRYGVASPNLKRVRATYAVAASCGDGSITYVSASPTPLGVTFVHVFPPSRVSWTSPSSVPTQMVCASNGDSAIQKIVLYTSPPAPSLVIGTPPGPCFVLSLRVRSGLIGVQLVPPSVERNNTLPP